jgi:type II secretory pathway component GspD/PulD (secretin)
VQGLLSEKATVTVDRTAGLLQVTDLPERLDRVAAYLDAVQDRVHQQVQIDARVLEVELNDESASGLDWTMLRQEGGATGGAGAVGRPGLTGQRIADVPRLLAALGEQGKVSVMAAPTLLALNNEPTLVHAATRRVAPKENAGETADEIVLGVTSQVAPDGIVTLSLNPMVSRRETGDSGRETTALQEADMLVRVASGETLVVAGFPRDRETRERRTVGLTGGWFGRSTVVTRKRVELLVLLTPRILGNQRDP